MKVAKWLIGLGAVLAALLAGMYFLRVPLASLAAEAWLAARGFPRATVAVASLETDRAELAALDLGPGLPATGRVVVRYRLRGLDGIGLLSVTAEGLRVEADLADPAPLARLAALLPEGGGASGDTFGPVIRIDGAALLLRTPVGDITAGLNATADLSDRPARAAVAAEGRMPFGRVSLTASVSDLFALPVAEIDGEAAIDLAALPDSAPLAAVFEKGAADLAVSGSLSLPSPDEAGEGGWLARRSALTATVGIRGAAARPYGDGIEAAARLRLTSGDGGLRLALTEPATAAGRLPSDLPVDSVEAFSVSLGLGPAGGSASRAAATLSGSLTRNRMTAQMTGEAAWVPGRPLESPLAISAQLRARGITAGTARLSSLAWKPAGTVKDGKASFAGPLDVRVTPGGGQGPVALAGRLAMAGTASAGRLSLGGGAARLPGAELAVRDLAAVLPWPFEAGKDHAELSGRVTDGKDSARFAPLAVSVRATPTGDGVALDGEIAAAGGALRLPVDGHYSPGKGRLSLGPATLAFGKGLRPADLGPALGAIGRASGTVEAGARFYMTGDTVDGAAELTLHDLTVETDDLLIEKMNGTVRLDGLLPPRTAAVQTVAARQIVAGLPLADVSVAFRLRRGTAGTVIDIRRALGSLAGGTVRIEDARIDLSAARHDVDIHIDGVDLEALLKEWAMEGLAGTGRLSGVIPVAAGPDGIEIRNGVLRARENGTLRVNWGDARETLLRQNENVALMVRTLEDFRYRVLEVALTRPPDGSLALNVTLEGHNPAVKDGYPFRFNISFSGDLEEIFAAVREGRRLGGTLLKGGFDFAR